MCCTLSLSHIVSFAKNVIILDEEQTPRGQKCPSDPSTWRSTLLNDGLKHSSFATQCLESIKFTAWESTKSFELISSEFDLNFAILQVLSIKMNTYSTWN